jgi:predicted esterase
MSHKPFYYLLVTAMTLVLTSCGSQTSSSQPANDGAIVVAPETAGSTVTSRSPDKPVPPLQLAVPAAVPQQLGELNFKDIGPAELFALARAAANDKNYAAAAIAQYWHVQASGSGQYDLACYLARSGEIERAFYWLQIAAIEEGVDADHSQRDEDLTSLRGDQRWGTVLRYVEECNRYFESAPLAHTVLILPEGYQKPAAIPAILWLHGFRSRPDDFVNASSQQYANNLNVALIGVSGTKARGPHSFAWADDVESNAKRLRDGLAEVSDRVTIERGQVVTLGFSQGAQVGLEVAVRYPEQYAGSIVFSPGAQPHLAELQPSPLLAQRAYVLCCNADEHPGNVQLTADDASWLRSARAKVVHKAYPGVSTHSFPQDFEERFGEWLKFIWEAKRK